MINGEKISSLKERRKRKQNRSWLRAVQVIGSIAVLILIYNGAASLLRLNVSYIENTLIPSQKISAVGTPEAKAFALDFGARWCTAPVMNPEIRKQMTANVVSEKVKWMHAERVEKINVKNIVPTSQYKGEITLEVRVVVAGKSGLFSLYLPLEYIPETKEYQVFDYPKITKLEAQ